MSWKLLLHHKKFMCLILAFLQPAVILRAQAGLSTEAELVPQWEKALFSSNDEVELVEVPLHTGADMYSTTRNIQSGEQVMAKSFPSTMRLIIARRTSGDTLMFVTTLVPTLTRSPHPVKSMNNFRYLGGGDFTGKVFCSTLEGRFVEVCQYVNGRRAGSLKATTRSQLEARGVDLNTMSYESITWSPASVVLNEQYGDEGLNPGGGSGMCSFHPSYPAESCPYCIEEVIVRSCQYCGARLEAGEVCDCRCDVCGSYPCKCCFYCGTYPCICESDCEICRPLPCMACEKCGDHFCFGTCEEEGHSNPGTSPTTYADALYDPSSTLTQEQKIALDTALNRFCKNSPIYEAMYDALVKKGIKFKFEINPGILEKEQGNAGYKEEQGNAGYKETAFYFKDEASIRTIYLQEELVHAVQEIDIYGIEYMEQARKNVEFEAKIIQDVVNYRYGLLQGDRGSMGQTLEFMDAYTNWMLDGREDSNVLIQDFHKYCIEWTGYQGNYDPNFIPKTIEKYLK